MYSQRQPSGGAPPGTQSSMNQDSGARRPLSTHIPQTPSGLRGAGPQRQFHRSGQSGSPPLPSQGIIGQGNPHTPQPSQCGFGMRSGPDASGLDDSFGPTTQQRHRGASIFSPDYSFPDFDDPVDPTDIPDNSLEGSSYRFSGGNQSSQGVGFTPYHSGESTRNHAPLPLYGGRSVGRGRSETPMEDYQSSTLYSGSYSRRGSYVTDERYEHESSKTSLNAVVAHLTASVERLSEANVTLTNELTSVKDENRSFAARLTKVEELVSKVEGKADQKPSKTRSNNHSVLKSILQPLFCKLCGIECDGTKTDRIVALEAVKPLDNKQPFEVSSNGVEIWHPNWLGDVCDSVNAKFISEVADRVYKNEQNQRANTNTRTLPDESFDEKIIHACATTYFRSVHKRVKELATEEGREQVEARKVQTRRQARRTTAAVSRRKAASQYQNQTGNKGAEALIESDLGSEILTCKEESDDTCQRRKDAEVGKDAKKVVGHAWRSIDYVAFLRWLTLRAKVQDEPNSEPAKDHEHPPKRRRTTRKDHKRVFDLAPKYLNNAPPQKPVIKAMVDEGWHQKHPEMEFIELEGVDWLTGFYSRVKKEELYDADVDYLRELDEYLKSQAQIEEDI